MFEVYYRAPEDAEREVRILAQVTEGSGVLDFREMPTAQNGAICLTYEFDTVEQAERVMQRLRQGSEHIHLEGPCDYGYPVAV